MTRFRPCIDLHNGQVKQIVGGTLCDDTDASLKTNFVSQQTSAYYAELYKKDGLEGGHVIKLGPNNDDSALSALKAWPQGLQIGGGITDANAEYWINAGASKVIVTSFLFDEKGNFSTERAEKLSSLVGPEHLVFDLSCRRRRDKDGWFVAINRWQTVTDLEVSEETLQALSAYCSEFLVHAADVEGLCNGIDEDLVACLGRWSPIPCTYAGGAKHISDLQLVSDLSGGKVDLTFGSSLDIFGGTLVTYAECVEWNKSSA